MTQAVGLRPSQHLEARTHLLMNHCQEKQKRMHPIRQNVKQSYFRVQHTFLIIL
jgi:hypothetical protein